MRAWGKTRLRDGGVDLYSVEAHLLDTAIVMEVLWDRSFDPALKRSVERVYPEGTRQRLALLAGVHDCGKMSPTFQCRLLDRRPPAWAPEPTHPVPRFGTGVTKLEAASGTDRTWLSHQMESGRALRRVIDDPWPSHVVEAHHGRFWDDDPMVAPGRAVSRFASNLEASEWGREQERLIALVGDQLGVDPTSLALPTENRDRLVAFGPTVAGWISIADWLASDEASVDDGLTVDERLATHPAEFLQHRRRFFAEFVPDTIGSYTPPDGSFSDVFGFQPTRPVQDHVITAAPRSFSLLAVPTGAGKTEAALERHRQLGCQSLYFAMPTMATADAMFARVKRVFEGGEATGAALLHGRASINDFYIGAGGQRSYGHLGDSETGLTAYRWIRGRHRGLVAPVGVGTVDQVFLAVLRAKYSTVRLAAAANTHIIFDEVHTYDPYQQGLLGSLLQWLGMHRTPVTLLSATVPTDLARRFANAYEQGWHQDPQLRRYDEMALRYPGVVEVGDDEPVSVVQLATADRREIALRYEYWDSDVATAATEQARRLRAANPAASIGVVLNTVDACIRTAHALAEFDPLVLHARMPVRLRTSREEAVLGAVGKSSPPSGRLVIGTQVLEHSLDIDFDFLVTQFAPAADVIQRAGRLWRHSSFEGSPRSGRWIHPENRRRDGASGPEVLILARREVDQPTSLPYMEAVIERSWSEGFGRGTLDRLAVPDDLQALIDRSHVTFDAKSLESRAVQDLLGKEASQRDSAERSTLPLEQLWEFDGEDFLCDVTSGLEPNEGATRWTDLHSEPIILTSRSNPWALHPDELSKASPERRSTLRRALIGASLSISGRTLRTIEPQLSELTELAPNHSKWPEIKFGRYLDLDSCETHHLSETLGLVEAVYGP